MKKLIFLYLLISFYSCKKETASTPISTARKSSIAIKYAEGFSISKYEGYSILEIKNPWPNSKSNFKYAIIDRNALDKDNLVIENYNGIILTPVEKIVVTSTTHISALELLNEEQTLIGFPGTDYISSEKIRQRIDSSKVYELGKNESINTEIVLDIAPEAIIAFGVDGASKSLNTIKNANIPVIYNGDWIEKSPLAKAEWIKFFGILYNKEQQADSIFKTIEKNYIEAKQLAKQAKNKPTLLSGAMYKDIWYLPNGESTEAQLLNDANTNYLWSDTKNKGSLSLSFETVFVKGKNADIWISPSYYKTLDALEKSHSHYTQFKAFKNKNIYSFTNTLGKTGGVLYYEMGITRPDIVLKDLIKICHPELLDDYEPFFFKRLE